MDKIEEIARAICEARNMDPDEPMFDQLSAPNWTGFKKAAEAAYNKTLQLIREPTEETETAGQLKIDGVFGPVSLDERVWATDVWRSMIDTLLEKGAEI